jgi:hypothetical protein
MNIFKNAKPNDHLAIEKALMLILEDKWDDAHEIAQSKEGNPAYDRVHALLHRIEGDDFNAKYWYRKVGEQMPGISIEQETNLLLQMLKDA